MERNVPKYNLNKSNHNIFHINLFDKFPVNKIAARWPAKAVAQHFTFSKKGSDRIVPR